MHRSVWFERFCSSLETILRANSFDYDRRRFRTVNYGAETFESRVLLSAVKPYLQNPAPDAMTVIWFTETNTAGTLTVNLPGGGNLQFNSTPEFKTELAYAAGEASTNRSNAAWMHRIRVTGLQEGTSYDYSVTQGLETYTGQLKTIPGKTSDVRFVVFGDSETEPESTNAKVQWTQPGSPSAARPYLVDQTVGYSENLKVIESRNPDFIGIAGDIVESGGEQRDWDEFWRHNAGSINDVASSIPIFAAPGNHENYGGPNTFGGYTDAGSLRAKGKFQTYWEAPSNGTGGYDDRYFRVDYGPITYISLDVTNGKPHGTSADTNWFLGDGPGYPDFNLGSIQYEWLETQLADAQAHSRFTFVQFHHVPYSTGPHGFPAGSGVGFDTQSGVPVRALTPLFAQYGVDAVLTGHDETYQHSLASGVHFFDVGMGGDGLRGPSSGTDSVNPTIQTNPFQVFTAHLNAPEVWNGAQLVSGGKHYGHMEVNVTFDALAQTWEAKLEPVYVFPLMNASGIITGWERRVYNDVTILTASEPVPPTVTLSSGVGSVAENGGSTTLTATLSEPATEDVFVYLQTDGTAVNNTDYQITSNAAPIAIDGDFSDWHNNPAILFGADPLNDAHDTDTNGAGNTPAYVNHPDVDLRAFGVTHDEQNLYFYFRSEGQIGRTQVANPNPDPALKKDPGRYYVIVTMDVDQDDVTGYDLHLGGYYPTTPGYDMNSEVEFYGGTFNTGHYLNHGAIDLDTLNDAFADQSDNRYDPALASQDIQGPFTPGFVDVIEGSYDFYTQWVYKDNDPDNEDNDSITFVKDKGPIVTGIIQQQISADGHELEMIVPYKGFLKDEFGNPIVDIGKILDLSFSLEASKELSPDNKWASDTADPLDGYELTAPSALPVNFIRIPKGQLSASIDLTATNNNIVSPNRTATVQIGSVTGAVEDGVQEVTVSIVNDDAPQIQTTPGTVSYTVGSPAVVIDAGLTSVVAAGSTYTGGSVSVGAGYVEGADILEFVGQAGITGNFNSTTGILTFTGSADPAAYQSILRSVTYKNVGGSPANLDRTVTFRVSSGSLSDSDSRMIQLMNIAQPQLIGIDFGSGGSIPTNWNSFSGSSNATFPDLIGEDGNNSGISAVIKRDTIPGGPVNFTPQASTLPQHTQSLSGLDRTYQDNTGNIELTWGNLTPGATYEIYVFAGNEGPGNPHVTITDGRDLNVDGVLFTQFNQLYQADKLFVNDQVGDSTRTLSSYAKLITANQTGDIKVRVDTTNGVAFFGTAGMAIRAVVPTNQAPVIFSDLGGPTAAITVSENQTAVTTVIATDADIPLQTLTYSITGGADAAKFGITSGGVLTFIAAPNYEMPTDVGADNFYNVQVTVTDSGIGNLTDMQDITVTVINVLEPLTMTIDYSLDTNNFFDTQAKKDLFQAAADEIARHLGDELAAIIPGGVNSWTADFDHPGTGLPVSVTDRLIVDNEIVIYAGGHDLGSTRLGIGGPGGFGASGSPAFVNTVAGRGEAGALDPTPTDFGSWGGAITFSTNASTLWHFGETTAGLDANESDFYSVALHELFHLLGFGTANSWTALISGGQFTGAASVLEYDLSGNVPLDPGLGHWLNGTTDGGQEAAMDPTIIVGTRKTLTRLDYAGLDDLGWDVIYDATPSLSINDITVTEGNAGTVNAIFTVTLSAASGQTVTVDFATANGTALQPGDYTSNSGTLTFAPGDTTKTITVLVKGDLLDEANETYFINLTNASNATISDNQGLGTITDDDATPSLSINDITVTEGNAGTVNAIFTVTLSAASGQTVTVDFATANGTALQPGDYTSNSGTLTFAPGDTTKTITVAVKGDLLDEANETYFINLTNASNATISDNQGLGTITDDDATPSLSINDITVTEGNAGTVNAIFTVTLSAASGQTVTVDFATANGTALQPGDYTSNSGTLTFAPGDTTKTITVAVKGDLLDEVNETYFINLTNASNATISDNQGLGTITDDDGAGTLSINDITVTEGNAGTVNAIFTVTLSTASGQTVTVDFATANGTALQPGDYTSNSGTLTFAPGDTTKTITVAVKGDLLDEVNETYFINLTNASNATISDNQGLGTITNDDGAGTLSINDITVTEGNAGTVNAIFTVTLSAASGQTVTVDFATANGTALQPGDYTSNSGTLTFAPGDTTKTITVLVKGDLLDEANETYFINLTNASNATISDNQGLGTITDDDGAGTLSINDITVTEGNAGTVNAIFTVTLSAASGQTVTVDFATANGTALQPGDYTSNSGTLTFAPGDTTKTITVLVKGDLLDEANETYFINLTNASNATISDNQGLGTITDDDATPSLSINDITVTEGNAGTVNAIFTVTLSAASGQTVTVDFATANGTALQPGDYTSNSGTLTFAPGDTTKTITVLVKGDLLDEVNETYFINLTNASNATISDNQGLGTITDDDATPSLSINDITVTEGNAGTVNAIFTVTLSAASGQTVTVDFATANGTALQPGDYTSNSGTLTFAPGDTTKTITVLVKGDLLDEANETYFINLTNASNATISDNQGLGTITDDDGAGTLSINDITVTEGNAGTVNAIFTVTLSAASGQTVTVDFATANGTALQPGDYTSNSGTLTFAPGDTTKTITVAVKGDLLDEANETYFINLTNASNATISDNQGLGTITDDDGAGTLSINDITVTEGNAGTVNAIFTVTLSAASGQTVTVDFATANGTALQPGDYTSNSGTLTFAPGDTTKTITVLVKGDLLDEANETYFINLTNASNATISDNQGLGTITDDDATPSLSINDITVTEGNAGTVNAIFTVTLSAASGQTVTVDFATANGTALQPGDYTSNSGTLTFAPGDTTKTITVAVKGDLLDEVNETYFINLTNASNATISDNQGLGTITDDDGAGTLSINDITVTEGNAGTVNAIFTVTLSAASGQTVTVDFATANGTALQPGDYTSNSGTLTFAPGDTTKTITVAVKGDLLDEVNETYFINLTNASNATISDNQGLGTITDDDATPSLSINDITVTEGNAGTVSAIFTVTLSAASGQTVTVDFATANGTALQPGDYTSNSGTLTFAPGDTTKTITVLVKGDLLDEVNETYFINLTNASNATISDNQGLGTITDDDATPSLSINDITVTEGNAGTVNAIFTVTLSAASGQTVTVDFATANGTALQPGDYTSNSGTLTFAPGDTTKTITVLVKGDLLDEVNETYFINLTNASNATISDNQGLGTITNDDNAATFSSNIFYNQNAAAEKNFSLDQTGQRSMVRRLQVVFDGSVTIPVGPISSNSFTITNANTSANIGLTVISSTIAAGKTTVILGFTSGIEASGSLKDGYYSLVINYGILGIDGNGDGLVGGTKTVNFHRFFGDSDGDRDKDGRDAANYAQGMRGTAADRAKWLSIFDWDNDGSLLSGSVQDPDDRAAFFSNFGRVLNPF